MREGVRGVKISETKKRNNNFCFTVVEVLDGSGERGAVGVRKIVGDFFNIDRFEKTHRLSVVRIENRSRTMKRHAVELRTMFIRASPGPGRHSRKNRSDVAHRTRRTTTSFSYFFFSPLLLSDRA